MNVHSADHMVSSTILTCEMRLMRFERDFPSFCSIQWAFLCAAIFTMSTPERCQPCSILQAPASASDAALDVHRRELGFAFSSTFTNNEKCVCPSQMNEIHSSTSAARVGAPPCRKRDAASASFPSLSRTSPARACCPVLSSHCRCLSRSCATSAAVMCPHVRATLQLHTK